MRQIAAANAHFSLEKLLVVCMNPIVMPTGSDHSSELQLGLRWLVRLRWIAVLGQTLICLIIHFGFGIRLPVLLLASCIGFIALSNVGLERYRRRGEANAIWVKALVLGVDVIVLTVMLFFTGGAHNPFTIFYLLHVTMAVILLPPWCAWATVALCTAGFSVLFGSDHSLESSKYATCCNDMNAHIQGMVVGLVLTGCGISYFVSRLAAELNHSRNTIALAQGEGERARRAIEVATLAAGIAHELATPLSTIAIVSQDLENLADSETGSSGYKDDAKIIRQEVERCRKIIEKLGNAGRAPQETLRRLEWNNLAGLIQGYLAEPIRERLETKIRHSSKQPLFPTSRLFQCLSILIKNAAESAPLSTKVILEAEIAANFCTFRVIDLGPGFATEIVNRLGEPLVTTKSKAGGLGLGLYLVKDFVEGLGGELNIGSSSPTVVSMKLPLIEKS